MNFISIGGWCGTKIALKDLGLFNEPSLPFDSVRSSIEGIIDCIENNFENFSTGINCQENYFLSFFLEFLGVGKAVLMKKFTKAFSVKISSVA